MVVDKKAMSLISVVIPCYNGEKYLNRCIDSLLAQSYPSIEIIVVNDCSNDKSSDLLKQYHESGIKVFENGHNLGAGPTRNIGIDNANGTYIYFCDIDDVVEPNYLAELHHFINGFDSAVGSYKVISPNSVDEINLANKSYYGTSAKSLGIINGHVGFGLALWNKLFNLDVIKQHKIRFKDIRRGQDSVFALEYFSKVDAVNVVQTNSYYCHFKDNVTSITNTINDDIVEGYIQISEEFSKYKSTSWKLTKLMLYRLYISQRKSIVFSSCSTKEKERFINVLYENRKRLKVNIFNFLYSLLFVRNFSFRRKLALFAFVIFDSKYDKLKKLFS